MASLTLNRSYQVAPDSELCVEFANTLDWRIGGVQNDQLGGYGDLLQWSHSKAILSDADTEWLKEEASRHPILAESVFLRAIALREAVARIFAATSRGESVMEAARNDLSLLNVELRPAMQQVLLVCKDDGVCLTCMDDSAPSLDTMLQPIALSAAETLTSPELDRVRQCSDGEGNGCGFFFVDRSRNRSRRWCSMESCGNRAKARRHYQREKAAV